jgi:hypothetical protein
MFINKLDLKGLVIIKISSEKHFSVSSETILREADTIPSVNQYDRESKPSAGLL